MRIRLITNAIVLLLLTACSSTNDLRNNEQEKELKPLAQRAPNPTASLHRPFDFPLVLSGNFGELRANHFHSGIDFKTQGEIGKSIHCAYDGYVSQVSVSGGGYGRAIYVTHPEIGLTTVYAHIEKFATKIDSVVRAEQYRRETFAINLNIPADSILVSKGEIIALSGNSGHSFGPHLHMEVRDIETGDAIDPLPYFKSFLVDTDAPQALELALYPDKNTGSVNGRKSATYLSVSAEEQLQFNAWGMVYPAILANDYMTNTHNVYGVKYMSLKVDGVEVYKRTIDRFQFEATRAINTLVDYNDLNKKGTWYMYTRVPKSQPLGCIVETSLPNGAVNIEKERDYKCEFVLLDEYGNKSVVPFVIHGVKQEIKPVMAAGNLIKYNDEDTIIRDGIELRFFKNVLYEDSHIPVSSREDSKYYSHIYSIGDNAMPLSRTYRITIDIKNDIVKDKRKYQIIRVGKNSNRAYKSLYKNGQVIAYVDRFGDFAVTIDDKSPQLVPVNPNKWGEVGKITYRISDNLSGIKHYRGEIDGKWVMFEADTKNSIITYNLNSKEVKRGQSHEVKLFSVDECCNESVITNKFYW